MKKRNHAHAAFIQREIERLENLIKTLKNASVEDSQIAFNKQLIGEVEEQLAEFKQIAGAIKKLKRTEKRQTFKGIHRFPLDMLRYDECWPEDTKDAVRIQDSWNFNVAIGNVFFITVKKNSELGFNLDRWRSFGWLPVDDEGAE